MATINCKEIVTSIIAGSGWALDLDPNREDPRVIRVVEYTTPEGATAWGLIYEGEDLGRYHSSPWVRNPRTIWDIWDARNEEGEFAEV